MRNLLEDLFYQSSHPLRNKFGNEIMNSPEARMKLSQNILMKGSRPESIDIHVGEKKYNIILLQQSAKLNIGPK